MHVQFFIESDPYPTQNDNKVVLDATYDFDNEAVSGLAMTTDANKNLVPLLNLSNGLYAQVLIWNPSRGQEIIINTASVVVEGTKLSQRK